LLSPFVTGIAAIVGGAATRRLRSDYGPGLLEFRILGPVEVLQDGRTLRLGGPKQRALLALLLLEANRVVSIDRLAEDLYGDAAPASAVTQIHGHVSQLRKLLGGDGSVLETRPPGYVIRLAAGQLDLQTFERLTREAAEAVGGGDAEGAASRLTDALGLWRGAPLADLAAEPFAGAAAARLDDLLLAAQEQQIDAWLTLGRSVDAASAVERLIEAHPYRERLRAQLMLALYRSGRQAEALEAYKSAREALVELGIEPTPALQELQRAILNQAAELDPAARVAAAPRIRTLIVAASSNAALDALLAVAGPLGRLPGRELILTRLPGRESELAEAAAVVARSREPLAATTRAAVFTSWDPEADLVRLATAQDAELLLVDAPLEIGNEIPHGLAALFERSPADVAVVTAGATAGEAVYVPFGGSEHDWAALELGALLAFAAATPLRLIGTSSDPGRGRRDASRLLAAASLAVERAVGVPTEPLLAAPTGDALAEAVRDARLVVTGVSPRWRHEGLGSTRGVLVRGPAAVVVVHRGPRPGGLAPPESATRFTWTIDA